MILYTAAALKDRFPNTYAAIKHAPGVEHRDIEGTRNIWCRDYCPVNGVQFAYCRDFLKYPQLQFPDSSARAKKWSNICLDGGDICVSPNGRRAIVTDLIVSKNSGRRGLLEEIDKTLSLEVIVIPHEPGDTLGHADGMVHWIDDQTVFLNDFKYSFYSLIERRLHAHHIAVKPFPWFPEIFDSVSEAEFRRRDPEGDDWEDARGYAINFLVLPECVLVPQFGVREDEEVARVIGETWPVKPLIGVPCREAALAGGLVNCVTWTCES